MKLVGGCLVGAKNGISSELLLPCDSSSDTKADHRQVSVTVAASTSVALTGKASGGVGRGTITSRSPINPL